MPKELEKEWFASSFETYLILDTLAMNAAPSAELLQ